jgi:penicillin amidase
MGRTRDLAFGFTYGFMDMVDYFIEECRDGKIRRGDHWVELDVRHEQILRRGKDPIRIAIRTTPCGVVEANPRTEPLADGFYLARAWSNQSRAASPSLKALRQTLDAGSVPEAQQILKEVTISCNWILADRNGNIGYQQSGRLPARRHSGLHPVPGWDDRYAWDGSVDPDSLHAVLNPKEGFLATANDDLNPPGGPLVINLPMGCYRADRIREVLEGSGLVGVEDMRRLQLDLYSLHAERLMAVLRPLLPESPAADILRAWDLRYDRSSRGAALFEEIYTALLRRVFGEGLFGTDAWDAIASSTTATADYYHLFDDVLLGDDPVWFGDAGREAVFSHVLSEVLHSVDPSTIETWGHHRRVVMANILFGDKLPRWLGFDHGPIELEGNRATVVQGQIFQAYGRSTSFGVSWRFVTDMSEDTAETILPGGPSGRRFSKWYRSEVDRWLTGEYKVLVAAMPIAASEAVTR